MCLLVSADYRGRTVRERSAKKNSYGKIRNGRTNINMEGKRSNTGDEGETSKSVGVPDCTIWSGNLDNEKTREGRSTPSSCGVGEEYSEYRGWRERQTCRSSRTSNRNGHWSQG